MENILQTQNMQLQQIKKLIKTFWTELLLASLAIAIGSFTSWRIYNLGLTKILEDQNAHLNFSRLAIDSITPGISQIGFWPPLLHILMIPFASINSLYITGLAGFFTLMPFLIIGTILIYKISLILTKNVILSFVPALLFILNPYVLYYTATPMMEILFLANLLATIYFLIIWLQTNKLKYLITTGIFVALTTLSRFEGLILIPLVGLIILLKLVNQRENYHKLESTMVLFSLPAVAGLIFILAYSWVFGGTPFAFAGGGWWVRHLSEPISVKYNLFTTIQYLIYASFYIINKPLFLIAVISSPFIVFISKNKLRDISVLLISFSPFIFIYLAVLLGIRNVPIYVPELPPFDRFFNERVSLTWIGFALIAPLLLMGTINDRLQTIGKAAHLFKTIFGTAFIAILIWFGISNFYNTVFNENFREVRLNLGKATNDKIEMANVLAEKYDFGKILATRVDNDPLMPAAGIPLKNYIHEGNYQFNDQTLNEPWFFARWVIMANLTETSDIWAKNAEPVAQKWGKSATFNEYYILVAKNPQKLLYKVNENAVRELAEEKGYNASQIPSINSQITWWDTQTIYSKIQTPDSSQVARKVSPPSKSETRSKLKPFYESDLKPYYKDGFYIDAQNAGNSESQSYALLQSYWAGDKETFDKVWEWSKENLQRKTDHLFSWKFNYPPDTLKVQISDRNSATDADTDIAYALLKAGEDWKNSKHIAEAKLIIKDLWEIETASASGKRNIIAGSWANKKDRVILNPSYFSPFAYRVFAKYDADHDWESLINDGYSTLSKVSGNELRKNTDIFLPPNWAVSNSKNGEVSTFTDKSDSTDYSYDAFRTFWRVAMDQLLYPNSQAKGYLEKASIFKKEWEKNKQFCTIYRFSEDATSCEFATSTLTGPLAVLSVTESRIASEVVEKYLMPSENITLPDSTSFYHKSWYWFGLGLWSEYFNNLSVQRN